jgi:hypothetical protein
MVARFHFRRTDEYKTVFTDHSDRTRCGSGIRLEEKTVDSKIFETDGMLQASQ